MNTQKNIGIHEIEPQEFLDWEIQSYMEIALQRAFEAGEAHSQSMIARTGKPTPHAYRATYNFKLIQVIKQLQKELEESKQKQAAPKKRSPRKPKENKE